MSPSDTTNVTETIMSSNPMAMCRVMTSLNISTPMKTAVTGSNAPRIAVGVEPMYCIAFVVQNSDSTVGKIARQRRFVHKRHSLSGGT